MAAVGFLTEAAAIAAIADVAESGFSDMVVELYVEATRVHVIWAVGLSIMLLGAVSMFIPLTGFDRVLGWIALVVGIVGLLPETIELPGTLAAVLWIIVTSIVVVARPEGPG